MLRGRAAKLGWCKGPRLGWPRASGVEFVFESLFIIVVRCRVYSSRLVEPRVNIAKVFFEFPNI